MTVDSITPRLIDLSPAGGCGCKVDPGQLDALLTVLDFESFSDGSEAVDVIAGVGDRDDAAVITVNGTTLAVSIDIQTPVLNDPFDWGAVSAVNAVSDLHATGATPLVAVSFLAWPANRAIDEAREVIRGGKSALGAERCILVGGHTIRSDIPMFGYAVIGRMEEGTRPMQLSAGRPGDVLVLSKPLGSGYLVSGDKAGVVGHEDVALATRVMTTSNRDVARIAMDHVVACATDVTGFGLVGHLSNLVRGSRVGAAVILDEVPFLDPALTLAASGFAPDGVRRNEQSVLSVDWAGVDEPRRRLLCDPQTAGGLLLAVPPHSVESLLRDIRSAGHTAARIGWLTETPPGTIHFT